MALCSKNRCLNTVFTVIDDGKLSFEEFKAYFSDGVLSGDELKELFHKIDTHNTDNVDTEELCEYFSQHLGEYENVLAALEDLNISILKAMDKTKKDYQEATHLEQFVTRFLLKETTSQLQSLQSSLECAMETTAEQTRQERQDFWVTLTLHILIVQRQLSVMEDELEEFRMALRQYVDCVSVQTGSLHVAVQRIANESRFILYEFWEHTSLWKNHLQTNYSKTFQRANVDFLETPEITTTMLVPASWWVLNNN
ncbi:hypothetical protein QTP70_000883 [Hemibagrus guttatus]|uniref:N-terminal EF-hand calcium-binding protein 1 n=1 Tax=Hemibagrus guttatus TaxID=175788 RepID=A0AAE0UJH4_9TELE|nr:hypothetical protein QTP70_000883 [Hemibagrus guttatus]